MRFWRGCANRGAGFVGRRAGSVPERIAAVRRARPLVAVVRPAIGVGITRVSELGSTDALAVDTAQEAAIHVWATACVSQVEGSSTGLIRGRAHEALLAPARSQLARAGFAEARRVDTRRRGLVTDRFVAAIAAGTTLAQSGTAATLGVVLGDVAEAPNAQEVAPASEEAEVVAALALVASRLARALLRHTGGAEEPVRVSSRVRIQHCGRVARGDQSLAPTVTGRSRSYGSPSA